MIDNFELIQKTRILFGAGEENNVGKLVKDFADSCLVVHDGGAYLEKLLVRVKKSLADQGITIYELPGVKANPLVSKGNEGVALCQENNIGFVLAVGGGSVMDTAKYIAYATHCPGNPLTLRPDTKVDHEVLPHGTVVTLSGTSSECSNCSMMVNDQEAPIIKYALANTALYFDFSIVNPELTYSLPPKQLASGAFDAISHALEIYLAVKEEEPLMEGYMEAVIKTVLKYGPMAMKDPENYRVRSLLSLCVMMAYNDNLSNGGVVQDWGIHGIENAVTATFNGTHGTVLGVLTPSYMRFVYKKNPYPFINFSVRCLGVDPAGKSDEEIVNEGASKLEDWLKKMGLPTSLKEIGLTADMLEECAEQSEPAGVVYELTKDEIMQIYKMAE
jgi:alcohol dehydrogenase YqhD (iron-dependent ADH family)